MDSSHAILILSAVVTLLALAIVILAIHLSKLHQILQGILLYFFVFFSFIFAYWVQFPITRAFAYFAQRNPDNTFYDCRILTEETCYRRADCTLHIIEDPHIKKFVCVSKTIEK
ncbi:hypothetical protein KBG31_02200 [Patescibacteria group bacterium]|nr:hypothetical protein [Patescibacteria group bacterium]